MLGYMHTFVSIFLRKRFRVSILTTLLLKSAWSAAAMGKIAE